MDVFRFDLNSTPVLNQQPPDLALTAFFFCFVLRSVYFGMKLYNDQRNAKVGCTNPGAAN
jgi:hypothetical protein